MKQFVLPAILCLPALLIGQLNLVEHTIDDNAHGAASLYVYDLDRDGDMDVLAAMYEENSLVWWRNDGGEPFIWTKFVIDSLVRVWPLYACDMDGDSDNDFVAASGWNGTNEVKWYENRGSGIVEDPTTYTTKPRLTGTITRDLWLQDKRTHVRDASGRTVTGAGLDAGIYFIETGGIITHKVVLAK